MKTPNKLLKENKTKVWGKSPLKKEEVLQWNEEKFILFFSFSKYFYNESGKFALTKENVEVVKRLSIDIPFYEDMLIRIDAPWEGSDYNRRFQTRLMLVLRAVKMGIEIKPSLLSPALVLDTRARYVHLDYLNLFYDRDGKPKTYTKEIQNGLSILNSMTPSAPDNPSGILLDAMGRVAEIYQKIAISITDKEIKSLDVRDRIAALQKLSYIHTTTKKFKPNVNFIKINTSQKSATELEDALLSFNDEQSESEGE